MVMPILPTFDRHPEMAAEIGRLLAGYGELELMLSMCVRQALDGNMDASIKALFRPRGESARIDIADGLARQFFKAQNLETPYCMAIGGMRYCLKIRNQYAHCHWAGEKIGRLMILQMEELAEINEELTDPLSIATLMDIDLPLLKAQVEYFGWCNEMFNHLQYEAQFRRSKIVANPFSTPPKEPKRPPLHLQ